MISSLKTQRLFSFRQVPQPIFVIVYGYILSRLFGDRFKEKLSRKEVIKKFVCFVFIGIGVNLAIGL